MTHVVKRLSTTRFVEIVGALFFLDRAAKLWAQRFLMPRSPIEVAPFFYLSYVENTGAAFGILRGGNAFLAVLSIFLIGAMIYLKRELPARDRFAHYGIVLIVGGALGNLFDRLALGYVIDFLDFRIWPVFNIADSCITIGSCCLAWGLKERH